MEPKNPVQNPALPQTGAPPSQQPLQQAQDIPPTPSKPQQELSQPREQGRQELISEEELAHEGLPPVITPPAKKSKVGLITSLAALLLLVLSIPVGVFLVQRQQSLVTQARSQASGAGDQAWDNCKRAGGSDAQCRGEAESAYNQVAQQAPISEEDKKEDASRDAFRREALEEIGGSEKLTPQAKTRIQEVSDALGQQARTDPKITPEVAAGQAQALVKSFQEGAQCRYPQPCKLEGGRAGAQTCTGTTQGGTCQYKSGVDPDCSPCKAPEPAKAESDINSLIAQGYTDYVFFDCDRCSADGKCQTPDIGVNPRFAAGNVPDAPCRQRDICNPKNQNDCKLISLCGGGTDKSCWGGGQPAQATAAAPQPPTGGPAPFASCQNIKAFDTNWNQLLVADLLNVKAGEKVRFTVLGSTNTGTYDKARFSINGATPQETTGKRPGTNEFFFEYTIPEGVTSFAVNAQLHHQSLGQWF